MFYLKIIILLSVVLITVDSYSACCAQKTRTITKRRVRCTPTTTIRNRYVKYPTSSFSRRSSKNKYQNYYNNSYSDNSQSAVRAANNGRLEKLNRIHELQRKLLSERNKLSSEEKKKIRKQILYISRPMRTMLGRSQEFPYFSEITTLDEVALSLVGKKSPYSEKGLSAAEILENIQNKQYAVFAASLPKD